MSRGTSRLRQVPPEPTSPECLPAGTFKIPSSVRRSPQPAPAAWLRSRRSVGSNTDYVMDEERLFTLEEARQLLPRLRTILIEAGEEWRKMRELNPEIQKVRDKVPLDGFSPMGVPYIEAVTHLM